MIRHHPHQDIIILINAADQSKQLEHDIRPACRCCYSHPFLFILRWHYKTCIHCEQMFFLVSFFACLFFRCSIKFHFILRPYYRTGIHCENMCACPLVHVKSNPQFSTKHFLGVGSKSCIAGLLRRRNRDVLISDDSRHKWSRIVSPRSYRQNWELYLAHKSRQMEKIDIDLLTLQIRETKALIWRSEQNCHMWWNKKKSDDEQTCVVKDVARHQALFQSTCVSVRAKCSSAAKCELRSHLRKVENCKMLNFCKSSCGDDRSGEAWRLDNFWTGLDCGDRGDYVSTRNLREDRNCPISFSSSHSWNTQQF